MGLWIQRRSNGQLTGFCAWRRKRTEQIRSGLYIDLNIENDFDDCKEIVSAFGYWIGRLPAGTKVMCSIRKPAREDKEILVSVDSVVYEDEMAA